MANMDKVERSKPKRIALNFDEEIKDIQDLRNKKGFSNPRDSRNNSSSRITEAIPRHPSWPLIKEDIIKAKLLSREDLD